MFRSKYAPDVAVPNVLRRRRTFVVAYAAREILPAKYEADMRHIALATIAEVDALVSWNFRHVVRLEKIRLSMKSTYNRDTRR